ncbi:MAG: 16S rRNA (cytosine(1402)-N(4))-methyltransferase [Thermoplasmata archaeon]|nr:MAG: 16S rRNA (cytosine(1402)-N(4))-methyltransferase [Thermoplasmata archaeon]
MNEKVSERKFDEEYFNTNEFFKKDPWGFGRSPYELNKYKRQIDLIKALISPKPEVENILEVGCAEGIFTEMLLKEFPNSKITGIEFSKNAFKRAKKRLESYGERVELIQGDIVEKAKELPEMNFDIATMSEVILYIGNDFSFTTINDSVFYPVAKSLELGGGLVIAQIVEQKGYPEGPLTKKPIIHSYKTMLAEQHILKKVYDESFLEYKDEENQVFNYEIWGFRRVDEKKEPHWRWRKV